MLGASETTAVGALRTNEPIEIDGAATLRQAATILHGEAVGALLIGNRDEVAILTERDVIRALAEGHDPDEARVEDFMTEDVEEVDISVEARDAAKLMLADEIRHLVVRGRRGVEGVVSIRDLLAAAVRFGE